MNRIKDEVLIKIPIKDNNEKLVDVKKYCPKIKIKLGTYIKKDGKNSIKLATKVREEVAKKINLAQNLLPKKHVIILRCGYRPLSLQKKRYTWKLNQLKKKNPEWSNKKLREETSKCIAPPDIIPPHTTGGAIDISILGPKKRQLKMGTKLGEFNNKTPTYSIKISKEERKNRELLINTMKKAGFVNYPTEWWHWSYGDRYWAAELKKKHSIYKGI